MTETKKKGKTQAQVLAELANLCAEELWVSHDRIAYATVDTEDHMENMRITSRDFSRWLTKLYWRRRRMCLRTKP